MKTTWKKLAGIVLAMLMALGISAPAYAAENGSITIDNAVSGQTYKIYKVLDLESYSGTAYAYKADSDWTSFVTGTTVKDVYLTTDGQGYVTWVQGADVAAFGKLALQNAKTANIQADASKTADSATVTFTGLPLGYYLVSTTLGTLVSLNTTATEVTIKEKNEAPSVDKQVQEDSTQNWGDTNDADISQTVNFKSTIKAKKGAQGYVLHDQMSAGLTFDANSVKVQVNGADIAATNYTVATSGDSLAEGDTFTVTFTQNYLDTITADTDIVVYYSATLNANAVIAGAGNPNQIKLNYGENSQFATEWDKTVTYTWDMEILKYANGKESDVLSGAKFKLLNSDQTKGATVVNGKITGWGDVANATELVTGEDGKIKVAGLDADSYKLVETEAPAGYNKLAQPVSFTVTAGTVGADNTMSYTTTVTKVENKSGTEMPSTGGMGTTLFYVIGGLVALSAAVLLVTKKRMSREVQ